MSNARPAPPPPPKNGFGNGAPSPAASVATTSPPREFAVISGKIDAPQRVLLYGPGGIGKTTLASLAPGPIFIDIEGGTREIDVPRIEGIETFADVRACLQSRALDGFKTVVLDSGTKVEELSIAHTLATVRHEKGHLVDNIEGYGFGKGLGHNYDTFMLLLGDLDAQIRQGRNVIILAHACIDNVPNPIGDDWIRWEPHFQSPKSGKNSIRNRVVQWADHVLFLSYDVVASEGKGKGGGSRTIYSSEMPAFLAKSRKACHPVPFTSPDDSRIWDLIFGGAK